MGIPYPNSIPCRCGSEVEVAANSFVPFVATNDKPRRNFGERFSCHKSCRATTGTGLTCLNKLGGLLSARCAGRSRRIAALVVIQGNTGGTSKR
jgi:hypothetical protein